MHRHSLIPLLGTLLIGSFTAEAQLGIALAADGPDYLTPGAPFTLARITRVETRLQNGSSLTHEEHERITRDAQGRVFDQVVPVLSDPLAAPAETYLLGDPVDHTVTEWASNRTEAVRTQLPAGARLQFATLEQRSLDRAKLPASVTTSTEDLGVQEIAGLAARGTRTTLLIPANVVGNAAPMHYVTEVWMSADLHIPLRELDVNPLTGNRTMNTEKIELHAGGAAVFHLPPGLVVHTLAKSSAPGNRDADRLAFFKALDDLKAPETREAAADTVVQYAEGHPDVATRAAHMLAIRSTHLEQARALAEGAVSRLEQTTASLTQDNVTTSTFAEMASLAEAWDALGSVYAASGDDSTAKRFFRHAWELGGRSMSLDRIAQIDVRSGNKAAALEEDLVALSGQADSRETDEITRRAKRLGNSTPAALPDQASVVTLRPGTRNPDQPSGDARFDLLFTGAGAPGVRWVSGSPQLRTLASAVAAAPLPPQLPDTGPEHLLRRVQLTCPLDGACRLELLHAWQAEPRATGAGTNSIPPAAVPPTPAPPVKP